MKRTIPASLAEKQELQRQQTTNKIIDAINDLRAEGYEISTKLLIERTELSRSTFSKPHVKEILRKNKVGKYHERISLPNEDSALEVIERYESELDRLKRKLSNFEKKMAEKDNKVQFLEGKLRDSVEECQLLRGKLHILIQKCKIKGISFEGY